VLWHGTALKCSHLKCAHREGGPRISARDPRIDNRTAKLIDHIRRILPGSQTTRFAVGYFFLFGLQRLDHSIAQLTP